MNIDMDENMERTLRKEKVLGTHGKDPRDPKEVARRVAHTEANIKRVDAAIKEHQHPYWSKK